jgi:uncharacterized protein
MSQKMGVAKIIMVISIILLIIGGLNWGWQSIYNDNLLTRINRSTLNSSTAERIVYGLVGLAAIYVAIYLLYSLYKGKGKNSNKY